VSEGGDIRRSYDTVADRYADKYAGELAGKPLDRALLDALAEMVREAGGGTIADVGCGPGHVARHLRDRGATVLGVDLSPAMIAHARGAHPEIAFEVGSFARLEVPDGAWAAAVSFYAIIHVAPPDRPAAFAELARAIRPGGWLLLSFHVRTAEHAAGAELRLDSWFDRPVDLVTWLIDPAAARRELEAAGFSVRAELDREAWSDQEFPSQRAYLLARRAG